MSNKVHLFPIAKVANANSEVLAGQIVVSVAFSQCGEFVSVATRSPKRIMASFEATPVVELYCFEEDSAGGDTFCFTDFLKEGRFSVLANAVFPAKDGGRHRVLLAVKYE